MGNQVSKVADKTQVSNILKAAPEHWFKLSELKASLGDVPDRTLRRWLKALQDGAQLLRKGERKAARYRWAGSGETSSQTLNTLEPDLQFSPLSQSLLTRTEAPPYKRPPVTYNTQWINQYLPNETFYLSLEQRTLLHEQGKRQGIHGKARTYFQKILNRMLIDISFNSARLEGNTYTLADTENLVLQGISATGKLNEERIMILNHKEAIRYLVQNIDDLPLNENTVCTLHYLLADSLVAPNMAGKIRDEAIGVSGTTYAPLEGRARLTEYLNSLLNKAAKIEDCFEQSFFLLGHIAYLQAFIDVNKRTARLASIIPLITQDYVPQSFVDMNQDDYLKACICFYEFNRPEPLTELYVWSYLRSSVRYKVFSKVVSFDEIAALYRPQRRAIIADIIRAQVPLKTVSIYLEKHCPQDILETHQEKFKKDVEDELKHLDLPNITGIGLTKKEFLDWKQVQI